MTAGIIPRRGRPRDKADISFAHDPALFYRDKLSAACETLSYHDIMALSRALGKTPRTIYNWRYGTKFPRDIADALRVLDWTAAGKPIKSESQVELRDSVMF